MLHHWYNMIPTILCEMGIVVSKHDPCLFSSIISCPEFSIPLTSERTSLGVGLYVGGFVFYSTGDAAESKFQSILSVS